MRSRRRTLVAALVAPAALVAVALVARPGYPLDGVSRGASTRGRLRCPRVALVTYRGEIIRYQRPLRVYRGFVPRLRRFEALVRPRINPELSDYFTALTGITQAMVDADGISFAEALDGFAGFIGTDTVAALSFGRDPEVLERNCRLCDVALPFDAALFINVVPALRAALDPGDAPFSSSDLPRLVGFAPPGAAHDAIGDARCIAEALRVLHQRGRL